MTEDFDSDLIVLTDEEGVESTWEHIATFELDDNCYVAMLPVDGCDDDDCDCDERDGDDDDGVWLVKLVKDENGDECFALIEDEEEYNAAADEYMRLFDDEFDDDFDEDDDGEDEE